MVHLGKRARPIILSDDEQDMEVIQSSTDRKVGTPTKQFRSSPSKGAKFWVESFIRLEHTADLVPAPAKPKRKPLSCVSVNTNLRKVQLSLDSFFSTPKKGKLVKDEVKSSRQDTEPEQPEFKPSEEELVNISEDDFEDDTPPPKKRKLILADMKAKPRHPSIKKPIISGSRGIRQAADQSDLPPISSIPAMFDDMVSHAPKLEKVVDRLNGRK